MKKLRLVDAVSASILIFVFTSPVKAGIVYESATGPFDSTTCCGSYVNSTQIIGARFTTTQPITIKGIGGHFLNFSGNGGSIFGAIVNLNGSGFPSATDLALDNIIASSVFTPTFGTDFLAPISATLNSGTYGIVFGSGLFGTTGSQALTLIQPGQQTSTSGSMFFSTSSQSWQNSPDNRHRIILSDSAPVSSVPLPPALWLFGSGFIGLAGMAKRRKAA